MAIVSVGYDGTVDEGNWADISTEAGKLYGVVGAGDWKVTAGTNPGQVNIAPGSGWGKGVYDTSDSAVTLTQGSLPASGSRWDMVVAHRDWTPPNGVTDFRILKGSATKQLPPRDSSRGVVDDQPVALVQWTAGQSAPTAIVDLRVWGGNGGMFALDTLALSYLGDVGARVKIGGGVWSRELDGNGAPVWVDEDGNGPWVSIGTTSGWSLLLGKCRTLARGSMLLVNLEARYTGSNGPVKPGWKPGVLPAGYIPSTPQYVAALTDSLNKTSGVWIGPNGIELGPDTTGNYIKVAAPVALK